MLKKAKSRLLTRAVQNRDCVFAGAYRTATVRESVAEGLFQQPLSAARLMPGIQKRDFGSRAASAKNSLRTQCFPDGCLIGFQRLQRLSYFVSQFSRIGVVDCQAFRRFQVGLGWGSRCGSTTR